MKWVHAFVILVYWNTWYYSVNVNNPSRFVWSGGDCMWWGEIDPPLSRETIVDDPMMFERVKQQC